MNGNVHGIQSASKFFQKVLVAMRKYKNLKTGIVDDNEGEESWKKCLL